MTAPAGALDAGNGIGGYFALAGERVGDGWRPMAELMTRPDAMADHIAAARAALAAGHGVAVDEVEPRVAASLAQQGLAARLVSPALAAMASAQWVPDLDLARLHWVPGGRGPLPLALEEPSGEHADGVEALAAAFGRLVLERAIAPVNAAVAAVVPVADRLLDGNTWSALAGALAPLRVHRPDLVGTARAIVQHLAAGEPDAGAFAAPGRYRRDTCCLYYRLPRGGLCGDCVLDSVPAPADR